MMKLLEAQDVTEGMLWNDSPGQHGQIEKIIHFDAKYGEGPFIIFVVRQMHFGVFVRGRYAHDVVVDNVTSPETHSDSESCDTGIENQGSGNDLSNL